MGLSIVDVVNEGETALVTLRVPVAALRPRNHDPLRAYLLRGLLVNADAAEVERRLKALITPAEAAWLVRRILGAPVSATTVARLKGAPVSATTVARLKTLFSAAELTWLRARIAEALA